MQLFLPVELRKFKTNRVFPGEEGIKGLFEVRFSSGCP